MTPWKLRVIDELLEVGVGAARAAGDAKVPVTKA
jgi:hypothetical protein